MNAQHWRNMADYVITHEGITYAVRDGVSWNTVIWHHTQGRTWTCRSVEGKLDVIRGKGMSLAQRLKRRGEINPTWSNPPRMPRRDNVSLWKDTSNFRPRLYDGIVLLGKTGSLGGLACTGGQRSRCFRRLWPCRGRLCQLASFRQNSLSFFERGWSTQGRSMPVFKIIPFVPHQSSLSYFKWYHS